MILLLVDAFMTVPADVEASIRAFIISSDTGLGVLVVVATLLDQ